MPGGGAARRVAELEAENAALRRALAEAGHTAEGAADRHDAELSREQAGRAAEAAEARSAALEAEARHGRTMATGRADLAASEESNAALRRANADLAASRAALREREERLRLILDSATDYAIFSMDLDRRVSSWNAGAARLLGWAEEEIAGRTADVTFTPEDREAGAPEQEAEGALRDGRAADERWHVRKDGSRFWANGLVLPLRDPAAGPATPPLGFLKVMRDETGRRRAEEAMRESEARFRALVRASFDVLYRISPDWTEMRQLSGGNFIADAPSPTRGWLEEYIHPDDRPLVRATIDDAIRRKGAFALEHRVRRPDGGLGWTHSRAVPILGADGGIVEWFGAAVDVTGRRETEKRLRESEARWRGLFEHMHEGFVIGEMVRGPDERALDYRLLEANAAWEKMSGIPAEAAVGRPFSEVIPAIERSWVETYARVVETGEPAHVERHVAPLGRWYEVLAFRIGPGRFAALVLEATERKRAEAALRESEGRRRAALDAARLGTFEWDLATGAVSLDRRSRELFGFAPGEGGSAPEIFGRIHPDDLPRVLAEARASADALSRLETEYRVRLPDGTVRALASLSDAVPGPGCDGAARMLGVFADITERKQAEEALRESRERLEAVVAHAAVGIAQVDLEGRFVLANDRVCEILGRAREQLLRGDVRMLGVTHPEDRPGNEAHMRRMLETGGPFAIEKRYLRPDGSPVWVHNHVSLTRDAEGRPRYITTLVQDVTERRQAEQRRALLVAELNHRVKNTLAVVQSLALQTARGASDLAAFSAAFQARLVALARAHDLLTRENWEGAALGDVVRAALEAGGEGRVDVACGCGEPDAPPLLAPAQALALALALALHELATNALKHGALSVPAGRVSVRCLAGPGDGARVVEWVERGGPPIAAAPTRRGFGLRLLERGLAAQAGMAAELRFEPEGLRCALNLLPVR